LSPSAARGTTREARGGARRTCDVKFVGAGVAPSGAPRAPDDAFASPNEDPRAGSLEAAALARTRPRVNAPGEALRAGLRARAPRGAAAAIAASPLSAPAMPASMPPRSGAHPSKFGTRDPFPEPPNQKKPGHNFRPDVDAARACS